MSIAESEQVQRVRNYEGVPGFCPFDLKEWLGLCFEAKVPYVTAATVATIPTDILLKPALDPELAGTFWAECQNARAMAIADPRPKMFRWSCCAAFELKLKMGSGEAEWDEECLTVTNFDPRAIGIIYDYPKPDISMYCRPWMDALIVDDYPLEFRVFVKNNVIEGISSYYPQRPLNDTPEIRQYVAVCREWTERLIAAQRQPLNMPQVEYQSLDMGLNHFTVDFLVDKSKGVTFLEGGPPHMPDGGGHMCCFKPGEISGVALSNRYKPSA